jgi:hypothetical protein
LRGLERLVDPDELESTGCMAIERTEEVAGLRTLKRLLLNDGGKVESLEPIRGPPELEEVLFYETTRIADGDLTPLTSLCRLRAVGDHVYEIHPTTGAVTLLHALGARSHEGLRFDGDGDVYGISEATLGYSPDR